MAPKLCSHQFIFEMEAPFRSYGMTFKHLVRGGGGGGKESTDHDHDTLEFSHGQWSN